MKLDRGSLIWVAVAFLIGVTAGIGGLTLNNRTRPAPIEIVPPPPTATPQPTATAAPLQVYVNGAVAEPAVYALPPQSRVVDAIEAAGGFTAEANTVVVNLAQPLSDGAQVYVPAEEETAAAPVSVVVEPAPVNSSGAGAAAGGGGLVNINTASAEELQELPGVGPSTAEKIVQHREANGPFATAEAIMDVSGIGEGKFAQIRDLITVGR